MFIQFVSGNILKITHTHTHSLKGGGGDKCGWQQQTHRGKNGPHNNNGMPGGEGGCDACLVGIDKQSYI